MTTKAKPQRTELMLVLDRSGSMEALREDVIGGLNRFFADQGKEPGECDVTVLQFDHEYEVVLEGVPVADVPRWSEETYVPRGTTALLDAMHRGVGMLEERVARAKDDPLKLVVVMTDGLENSSREVDRATVMEKVERLRGEGWGFIYLGANQDAIQEGTELGVAAAASNNYAATRRGTKAATRYASRAVSDFRFSGGDLNRLQATVFERADMMDGSEAPASSSTDRERSDKLLNTGEAADIVGVSPTTLRRMRYAGEGPAYVRPSKRKVGYRREDLTAWLESKTFHNS